MFTRRAGQLLLAGALVASCQAGHAALPAVTSAPSTTGSPAPSPVLQTRAVRVPLDIGATGRVTGRTLSAIPLGTRTDQLGLIGTAHDLNPLLPAAFVSDPHGIWVLDPVKKRVARFDLHGRYLGQVVGVSPVADDLAPLPDGRLLISDDPSDRPRLRVLTPGPNNGFPARLSAPIDVHGDGPDGSPENLFRLAWTSQTTGVWTSSGMRPLTKDLHIDRSRLDLPLPGGGALTAAKSGDADWTFQDGTMSWQVSFTSRTDPDPIVTVETLQEHAGSLYLWVSRGSSSSAASTAPSGRFLIILPRTGAPRAIAVADSNSYLEDANLHRHFNVTADGKVVQMTVTRQRVVFSSVPI